MTPEKQQEFLRSFSDDELALLYHTWEFNARPEQLAPVGEWDIWILCCGRGFGKTRTITEWASLMAEAMPGSQGAIIGATAADTRDVLVVAGQPASLQSIAPPWDVPEYSPAKRRIKWKNGTIGLMFSADEPNRLRGPQFHWAICDEFAAWRFPEAFDMLMMGLRLGDAPRCVIGTTPKPYPHVIQLIKQAKDKNDPSVRFTTGTTYDNRENLPKAFFNFVTKRYEGTSLGRQELMAELLEDAKGSLWKTWMFNRPGFRVAADKLDDLLTHMKRIVVAIDPAAKSAKEHDGKMADKDESEYAETGIVVAGLSHSGHGYILDDLSLSAGPNEWATVAISAYKRYLADRIVAEVNNGGDMVENTIRMAEGGPNVSYTDVTASRGKEVRAEPIVALYEQGKIHHVGVLAELESQQTQWSPGQKSPDRLDAAVWALTELMVDDEDDIPSFRQGRMRDRIST